MRRTAIVHAAALAVVRWYLMIPPEVGHPPVIRYQAPLREWDAAEGFDSEKACFEELHERSADQGPFENYAQERSADEFQHGRCVRSDDPRVKEK